jgi:hypothetical protein
LSRFRHCLFIYDSLGFSILCDFSPGKLLNAFSLEKSFCDEIGDFGSGFGSSEFGKEDLEVDDIDLGVGG